MNKIAFDLDGVLIPDYKIIPDLTEAEFFEQTNYVKPLFHPLPFFDIVTARVESRREVTMKWLKQLKHAPNNVFMRPDLTETPAEFKYRISVEQQYNIYVESDDVICAEMRALAEKDHYNLHVIHYDTWVSHKFYYL